MEQITLEGWKGESGITVQEKDDFYEVIEYRKDKHSGEVQESRRLVRKSVVEETKKILLSGLDVGKSLRYREIVSLIQKAYGLEFVGLDAWNGGSNRAKYFFPIHYYPIKILEKKGIISYSGRGTITRLR